MISKLYNSNQVYVPAGSRKGRSKQAIDKVFGKETPSRKNVSFDDHVRTKKWLLEKLEITEPEPGIFPLDELWRRYHKKFPKK